MLHNHVSKIKERKQVSSLVTEEEASKNYGRTVGSNTRTADDLHPQK